MERVSYSKEMKEIPIVGLRFGRLIVLSKTEYRRGGHRLMACHCDCGKNFTALSCNIRRGDTKSCGCYNSEVTAAKNYKHGQSGSPEFWSWWAMLDRCTNPKYSGWDNYGGRGITVCSRWSEFKNFLADMGEKPSRDHSIDRIDVNGNYEPSNCRWATSAQQANNTRRNVHVDFNGERMTLIQFCRMHGVESKRHTVKRHHFKKGIPLETIIQKLQHQ